jgi:hypothetical protein
MPERRKYPDDATDATVAGDGRTAVYAHHVPPVRVARSPYEELIEAQARLQEQRILFEKQARKFRWLALAWVALATVEVGRVLVGLWW